MSGNRKPRDPSTRTKLGVERMEAFDRDLEKFLNPGQRWYIQTLTKRLEDFGNQEATSDLRIERINNDLWELKAKHNILSKTNVRAFFAVLREHSEVVMLGAFKKENEGATRPHWIIKMQNRLGHYLRFVRGGK